MNESRLHQHIYARSATLTLGAGQLLVGPGDDCAVISTTEGDLLYLTVDQLVAGRHFEPGTDIDLIARKAVARSVSDIAAMGGRPAWALATALLPEGYPQAAVLFDAMSRWANHWHCPLIGGDIASHASPDHPLTLTVTIGGEPGFGYNPVLRSGAKPGDLLYLTGRIGGSLKSERHLTFEPRLEAGEWASKNKAHAMIDLSDGLGRDSDRIAQASKVILEIDADTIPLNDGVTDWKHGVSDGEDHELLIALSPDTNISTAPLELLGPIGRARACGAEEEPASIITDGQGRSHPGRDLGWDH
ncbi:MAG: thiamine-phosphate kinase [Phycisphaerales bacterium]